MAGTLALNVEILGEFKNLTNATQGAANSLKGLEGKVQGFASNISRVVGALGISLGFTALVQGAKDAVAAASDLDQQFGALDSIFKGNSNEMKVFSKEMNEIGLSSADAARQSSLLGAMLKGSGLSIEDTTDKTKDLVRLAGDLAATFGGPTSDAVNAISSLLKGERDPIERYGVSLKQLDVNAQKLTDAKNGLVFASDKEADINATLTLLYQKTTDAQGQAARESDTYAAKMAELNARMTDAQATIGDALLPALVLVSEWFIDVLPDIQNFFEGLVGALDNPQVNTAITNMQTSLGNLGFAIGSLFGSTETDEAKGFMNFWIVLANVVNGLATALSALLAPISAAFGNTKPMENWLDTILNGLLGAVGAITGMKQPTVYSDNPGRSNQPRSSQTINNNITVQTNATAQDIANAINKANRVTGTNIIR
jgi:type IV secretory pathway VirB2 component (pilin)